MCKPERRHIIVILKMYKMCNTQTNFDIKIVLIRKLILRNNTFIFLSILFRLIDLVLHDDESELNAILLNLSFYIPIYPLE